MSICQQKDIKCYKKVDSMFTKSDKLSSSDEAKRDCQCWPSCTTLVYDTEVLVGQNDDQTDFNETNATNRSYVKFSFKDTEFLKLKRVEIYDSLEFFANCGGLFGKMR